MVDDCTKRRKGYLRFKGIAVRSKDIRKIGHVGSLPHGQHIDASARVVVIFVAAPVAWDGIFEISGAIRSLRLREIERPAREGIRRIRLGRHDRMGLEGRRFEGRAIWDFIPNTGNG